MSETSAPSMTLVSTPIEHECGMRVSRFGAFQGTPVAAGGVLPLPGLGFDSFLAIKETLNLHLSLSRADSFNGLGCVFLRRLGL